MDKASKRLLGDGLTVTKTDTSVATGPFYAIEVMEDAVFSDLSDANDATPTAMQGRTIKAGRVLRGDYATFTLTSGVAKGYKG